MLGILQWLCLMCSCSEIEFVHNYTVIVIVIVTTGASCLSELLKVNNSLQELHMRENDVSDDGMSSIADGLQYNNTLTVLNVSECGFSVKGTYCSVQDRVQNNLVISVLVQFQSNKITLIRLMI